MYKSTHHAPLWAALPPGHPRLSLAVRHKHVLGSEITVGPPLPVKVGQALGHLAHPAHRVHDGEHGLQIRRIKPNMVRMTADGSWGVARPRFPSGFWQGPPSVTHPPTVLSDPIAPAASRQRGILAPASGFPTARLPPFLEGFLPPLPMSAYLC